MSDFDREAYAQEQRRACKPLECSGHALCWVRHGTKDALVQTSMTKRPRCAACGGKLLYDNWKTPSGLCLPAHGRLNPRAVESKRARPREPGGRVAKARPGDSAAQGGVPLEPTPASGSFL